MELAIRGGIVLIDEADLPLVKGYRWRVWTSRTGQKYALARRRKKTVNMSRVIMNPDMFQWVDHENGDGLDNRRCNLRKCTPQQNKQNTKLSSRNTSGFKGVSLVKRNGKFRGTRPWLAKIRHNGISYKLGRYGTAEEAARVYDVAALMAFGEFARVNFANGTGRSLNRSAADAI